MTRSVLNRKSLLVNSVVCFAIALLVLLYGQLDARILDSSTILIAYLVVLFLLLVVMAVGWIWLAALEPKTLVWLHTPLLITIWVFLLFGLPGLYALVRLDTFAPLELLMFDPFYSTKGMWLMVVGCGMIWLGYAIGYGIWRPLPFVYRLSRCRIELRPVLAFYGVTVALQLVQITVAGIAYGADRSQWGMFSPFLQFLGYLRDADRLVLALVALQALRRRWPLWPLIVIVFLQTAFGFISGFMKPILWIAVILLMAAIVVRVNPRRLIAPAAFFVILGILVVPVAIELRSQKDAGWLNTSSIMEVTDATAQSLSDAWSAGANANWQRALDRTLSRNAGVAFTPGLIMQKTPSLIPYQGIEQFLAIPAYIIPRAIWPDKPTISRGVWFSITYLNQPDFTTSSAAITFFGEGYMFAGWLGAILACLVIGLLLAFVYQNTVATGLLPIFLALLPSLLDAEGQFTGMFVGTIQQLVVYLVLYWLMGLDLSKRHKAGLLTRQTKISIARASSNFD